MAFPGQPVLSGHEPPQSVQPRNPAPRPTCLFCGTPGPLTDEHVYGKWMRKLGSTGEGVRETVPGNDAMLKYALHLRGQELSLRDIASQLVIPAGKKKGQHPSAATVLRMLRDHDEQAVATADQAAALTVLSHGEVDDQRLRSRLTARS